MDEVFPLPLEKVWELLHAHLDESRLGEIHPRFVRGRLIREGESVEYMGRSFPREKAAERVIRIGGRSRKTHWDYRIEPPTRYDYNVSFANGSTTRFVNRYSKEERGTRVKTTADISLKRIPSFLARWIVARSLDRSDREDLAYLNRTSRQ